MAPDNSQYLSRRGWANIEAIMPKIKGAVEERKKKNNTNIDLSTAENWLIRSELMKICNDSISQNLTESHFSYPRGFSGDPDLLEAYSNIFNKYFTPHQPVKPSHLATAPGASACIDALLYNICDPEDGVLVPGPYWNGFDFGFQVRSSVTPVVVSLPSLSSTFTHDLLPALEEAKATAKHPIKALMITNPQNPLGLCYPKPLLEKCIRFCKKHDISFISDEVYALSNFKNPEIRGPVPFCSVLSLDLDQLGADASRVHMVWSVSKDLGQSGFRMGCTVTQSNEEMAVGLALAANTQISALSTIFVTNLLSSPRLPLLLALNSKLLAEAYMSLTAFLKEFNIPYIPCNAGLYVFAKVAPGTKDWDGEARIVARLKEAGVLVSSGRVYHGPESEKGWARIGFAIPPVELKEAIQRMRTVFKADGVKRYEANQSTLKRSLIEVRNERQFKRLRISS